MHHDGTDHFRGRKSETHLGHTTAAAGYLGMSLSRFTNVITLTPPSNDDEAALGIVETSAPVRERLQGRRSVSPSGGLFGGGAVVLPCAEGAQEVSGWL